MKKGKAGANSKGNEDQKSQQSKQNKKKLNKIDSASLQDQQDDKKSQKSDDKLMNKNGQNDSTVADGQKLAQENVLDNNQLPEEPNHNHQLDLQLNDEATKQDHADDEQVVQSNDDLDIQEHVTVETKGRGLADHLAEVNKSFNATEQNKEGSMFYDPKLHQETYTNLDRAQADHEEVTDIEGKFKFENNLPEDVIQAVQQSWDEIVKHETQKVGIVIFKNIFKIAPQSLQLFPFKDSHNLYEDVSFKKHAKMVADTIGLAVSMLRNIDQLVPVLQDLGFKHAEKGVKPQHYPVVKQALLNTLKAGLKEKWTRSLSSSWSQVYDVVAQTMIGDLYDSEDIWTNDLNKNKIEIIQSTWNQVVELGYTEVGHLLFTNLFNLDPALTLLFPFTTSEDYSDSELYQEHVTTVIKSIEHTIDELHNFETMEPILRQMGHEHMNKGVKKQDYETHGKALLQSLQTALGDKWKTPTKRAWTILWNFIKDAMISSNYEEKDRLHQFVKDIGINQEDIKNVVATWRKASSLNSLNFGLQLMQELYAICPEVNAIFQFSLEPNEFAQRAGDFGTKIFRQMTSCVAAIDQVFESPEILESIAAEVRSIHKKKELHLDTRHHVIFRESLIETIEKSLDRELTNPEKSSWVKTYNLIRNLMHLEDLDKTIEQETRLDTLRVRIVQQSWKKLKRYPIEISGPLVYKNLFALHPAALEKFPFKDQKNYLQTAIVKKQTAAVVGIIGRAIESLDNFEQVVTIFTALGEEHETRQIGRMNFNQVEDGLYGAIKEVDGPHWDVTVEQSWRNYYRIISTKMLKMHDYDVYQDLIHPQKNDNKKQQTNRQHSMRDESTTRPLIEKDEKVSAKNHESKFIVDNDVVNLYKQRFTREVDFHHKICYRFEKAYRLGKTMPDKRHTLNLEVIDCISDHSSYIEQDHLSLFYMLYFCIYFKNSEIMNFIRMLIQKIPPNPKIDRLLEMIDVHGIDKLRQSGEQANQLCYHMVFYQAIDDNLRIVYSQILRQLRFVQLRDKDASHLLNSRDYEIIQSMLTKYSTKMSLESFGYPMEKAIFKCHSYRKYNQAYFEEMVINYTLEQRVALNYREKFLVTAEEIYIVFEMYCKEDYDEQFARVKKNEITHRQFLDLFIICLKNNSFKIAMYIYTLYLNPSVDIDEKMMDIIMLTLRESQYYHEIKLFFIHEHFDVLSVQQLNTLVDIYQTVMHTPNIKLHPVVNQFNTIKVSLLIYRICWKIEQKQIYSLITKCTLLQTYLVESLSMYFEMQNNILTLYKLMLEPILHMSERKDSLDIMYEMNMSQLLQHPVVVEVLNLVNEGKYSINASALSLSQSYVCLDEMNVFSLKSIFEKIVQNIVKFGDTSNSRQSALMYNIWKQSIDQRQQDEMFFTSVYCCLLGIVAIKIGLDLSTQQTTEKNFFNEALPQDYSSGLALALKLDDAKMKQFCTETIQNLTYLESVLSLMNIVVLVYFWGMLTNSVQQIATWRIRDNVHFQFGMFLSMLTGAVMGFLLFYVYSFENLSNPYFSNMCQGKINMSQNEIQILNHVKGLYSAHEGQLSYIYIMSLLIIQSMLLLILMLQRTSGVGQTIKMLTAMIEELGRFFLTFGLMIVLYLIFGRFASQQFKEVSANYWEIFLNLFDAFNGKPRFEEYKSTEGKVYLISFVFILKIFLVSLLVAMFINKYQNVWKNLDASKRFSIIRLKNSNSWDRFIGGVTLTFFPINIFILPFIPIILYFKSKRASDFFLKIQWVLMMLIYACFASAYLTVISPVLYAKIVANSVYIVFNNRREDYRGQNIVNLIVSSVASPVLIFISILVDLLTLPAVLLRDSNDFEHKYQQSEFRLTDVQIDVVMVTFGKIFYGLNFINFKDSHMTLIELMMMHRRIFSLTENLHDLFCKGNKDYREALSKVQDYNMTKVLTRQCSIPDLEGNSKESKCELNVIHAVQFDIENYNYIDILLRKLRMGILVDYIKSMEANVDEKHKVAAGEKNQDDEEDDELKKIEGIFRIGVGPDGNPLKRNNSDVMNNFWINYVVRSFTNCEEILSKINQAEKRREKRFMVEVEQQLVKWKDAANHTFANQTVKYNKLISKQFVKYDGSKLVEEDDLAEDFHSKTSGLDRAETNMQSMFTDNTISKNKVNQSKKSKKHL